MDRWNSRSASVQSNSTFARGHSSNESKNPSAMISTLLLSAKQFSETCPGRSCSCRSDGAFGGKNLARKCGELGLL
jgi:hypothetical protein